MAFSARSSSPHVRGVALVAAIGTVAGISCAGTPDGTVAIVTGEEIDAFSRSPAPTMIVAERIAVDGSRAAITRSSGVG